MEDKCPFCGAEMFWQAGQTIEYKCNTRMSETGLGPALGYDCLKAQIAALKAGLRKAVEVVRAYHEAIPTPESTALLPELEGLVGRDVLIQ